MKKEWIFRKTGWLKTGKLTCVLPVEKHYDEGIVRDSVADAVQSFASGSYCMRLRRLIALPKSSPPT